MNGAARKGIDKMKRYTNLSFDEFLVELNKKFYDHPQLELLRHIYDEDEPTVQEWDIDFNTNTRIYYSYSDGPRVMWFSLLNNRFQIFYKYCRWEKAFEHDGRVG
jgi:hypothetical protein